MLDISIKILDFTRKYDQFTTADLVQEFSISRQYVNRLIQPYLLNKTFLKIGSTRKAFYIHKDKIERNVHTALLKYVHTYNATSLEEHDVLLKIEKEFPVISLLSENIKSIFDFAFSEMLNNAIEHSHTKMIHIKIIKDHQNISFTISDAGIGVFRNIMNKKNLKSDLEAIQELLKGKATTMPRSHSGEGIFFTSRVVDFFILDSFGKKLIVDGSLPDTFIENGEKGKRGTEVSCRISLMTKRHLSDIFRKYTNLTDESDYGFDKTEIQVKLYSLGGVYISRSQARRILSGLEKFSIVTFDFDNVPVVGQAFADEIFRVFQVKHSKIRLETKNMNENVEFMIKRALNEARRSI